MWATQELLAALQGKGAGTFDQFSVALAVDELSKTTASTAVNMIVNFQCQPESLLRFAVD